MQASFFALSVRPCHANPNASLGLARSLIGPRARRQGRTLLGHVVNVVEYVTVLLPPPPQVCVDGHRKVGALMVTVITSSLATGLTVVCVYSPDE